MREYDAFRQGVEPGGMMTTADVRLLVCYLLKGLGEPVTKEVLTDALCEGGLANFFEVTSAADALVELGQAEKSSGRDGKERYSITESGKQVAETLLTDLPRSVREKALRRAMYRATMEKRSQENEIETKKTGDGYEVNLSVGKGEDALMRFSFRVPAKEQARALEKGFLEHLDELCEEVYRILLQ